MKKLFLLTMLIALPSQALGAGCGCGSIQAMITSAKMETIQTVNASTAAEAASIRSEILVAAQNIIGTIKSESATIVRAIISLKESNAAMLKGQAVAGQATRSEDMYGKAAQPAGLCGAASLGAGVQLGAQASQQVHQTMRGPWNIWSACCKTNIPLNRKWQTRFFPCKKPSPKNRWRKRMKPSNRSPIPVLCRW